MDCKTLQFPWKLHVLLAHAESKGWTDIVSWMPEGTAFKVHDKRRFEKHIMPKYFKTTTYKSFQRNCNIWGFETKTRGFETGFLFHPYFQKGKSDLCNRMVRGGKNTQIALGEILEESACTNSMQQQQHSPNKSEPLQRVHQNPVQANGKQKELPSCVPQEAAGLNVNGQLALLILMQQQKKREQEEEEMKRKKAEWQKEQMALVSLINRILVPDASERLIIQQSIQLEQLRQAVTPPSALRNSFMQAPSNSTHSSSSPSNLENAVVMALENLIKTTLGQQGNIPPRQTSQQNHSFFQKETKLMDGLTPTSQVQGTNDDHIQKVRIHKQAAAEQLLSTSDDVSHSSSASSSLFLSQIKRDLAAQEGHTKLIPCRARGVPLTHNSRSAVFEITKDTEHGSLLLCSHPACRAAGVKFRYCAHCKLPVAKRTFWALHGHGAKKSNNSPRRKEAKASSVSVEDAETDLVIEDKKNNRLIINAGEKGGAAGTEVEKIKSELNTRTSERDVSNAELPLKKRKLLSRAQGEIFSSEPKYTAPFKKKNLLQSPETSISTESVMASSLDRFLKRKRECQPSLCKAEHSEEKKHATLASSRNAKHSSARAPVDHRTEWARTFPFYKLPKHELQDCCRDRSDRKVAGPCNRDLASEAFANQQKKQRVSSSTIEIVQQRFVRPQHAILDVTPIRPFVTDSDCHTKEGRYQRKVTSPSISRPFKCGYVSDEIFRNKITQS